MKAFFNSLGSNYNGQTALQVLLGTEPDNDRQKLCAFLEKRYGGAVTLTYKGREALQLALSCLDLPAGSAVAITGFTCYAVYKAVKTAGCNVEYLDVAPNTLHFSADTLTKTIRRNPHLKAVIVQNTLGQPCDIVAIEKICRKQGLYIIEDLAHSVGAHYADGREAGTVGDFVMLSFGRDKLIDAVTGGALIIRHPDFQDVEFGKLPKAPLLSRFRDRLYPALTLVIRRGYEIGLGKFLHAAAKKSRLLARAVDGEFYQGHQLAEWSAHLALKRYQHLASHLEHRAAIAHIYQEHLPAELLMPTGEGATHLRVAIRTSQRKKLTTFLAQHNIFISDTWYDSPIAPPRFLRYTDYDGQCPEAEKLASCIINLPTHQAMTSDDAINISRYISEWQRSLRV